MRAGVLVRAGRTVQGAALLLLLGAPACGESVAVSRRNVIPSCHADEAAERVRDRFTRAAVHPFDHVRWIEVTLHDLSWHYAAALEWARYSGAGVTETRSRIEEVRKRYLSGKTGFEVWLFADSEEAADLAAWTILLDAGGRTFRPTSVTFEVMGTEEQTLTVLDAQRRLTLRKVRGQVAFPEGLARPGERLRLTLVPPKVPEGALVRFVWKLSDSC